MKWSEAIEILRPIPTDDYIGGAWNPIRYAKMKAFFELAGQVKEGVIVELGTFRGLGAIALSLGASVPVFTVDDYAARNDLLGIAYDNTNRYEAFKNFMRSGVSPTSIFGDVQLMANGWNDPVGMLVWDLGIKGRLKEDLAAWLPKLTPDALVVVKDLETGEGFGREGLNELGFHLDQVFPEGAVYSYRRETELDEIPKGYAIWIVDGDQYVAEAKRSGESVKRHMPELTQTIYQPNKREHAEWFIESTRLLVKVLESLPLGTYALWLDSDTYLLDSVPEILEMLDRFDMVLSHAPGHQTAPTRIPVPDSFPEFQIGVIAMMNCEGVRDLWRAVYANQKIGIATDQAALRETIWCGNGNIADLRIGVFPSEYDFRFQFGGQVRDKVKILHGHADSAAIYELIGADINSSWTEGYQIAPRLIPARSGRRANVS